jgi:catechol 2,3-dioxygenase-like lactoylglutathione lyase family enzyme
MQNVTPKPGTRFESPKHPLGMTGIDHVALSVNDPERAVDFYTEVLGGTVYYATGFSDEERAANWIPHTFVHVGKTLIQVGVPNDRKSYPDPESRSYWPHWSFGASPEVLDRMAEQLTSHGIPYSGPRSHPGTDAVSLYFIDPDGNKLEICTWEPYPLEKTEPLGSGTKGVPWGKLRHDWRSSTR